MRPAQTKITEVSTKNWFCLHLHSERMALAISDKKENQNGIEWDINSYNNASQKLFKAALEDLDEFNINDYPIIKMTKSIIKFPKITCPKLEIVFYSMAKNYDKYPLNLEIVYQFRTILMIKDKDKNEAKSSDNDNKDYFMYWV